MSSEYFILIVTAAVFLLYFSLSWLFKKMGSGNFSSALTIENGIALLNAKHIIGILGFGVIFWVLIPDEIIHLLRFDHFNQSVILIILVLVVLSVWTAIRSSKTLSVEKEMVKHVSHSGILSYFLIRTVFLFCYELFFRGVLLFLLIELAGIYLAFIIAVGLYVLIHSCDTRKEMLGCIPFGFILCLIAVITQSVWGPFLIHLGLSMGFELTSFLNSNRKILTS